MSRFPACILATAVVPWTDDLRLDEELFRDEVRSLLGAEYRNLYIFGTAGEGYAVDEPQFQHVTRVFVEEMDAGGAQAMVGVISLSLETMLGRIAWARDTLGVRLFQISLPSWGALEADEVRRFFDAVLGRFEDCRFLHYNLLRTKRLVTAAEYAAIAADHPNLVATKNSTDAMQRVRDLLDQASDLRHFLNERGFLYGSLVGECGFLISLATINQAMAHAYFEAGRTRDVERLLEMDRDLHAISGAFHRIVAQGASLIDGAYDKVLWRLHDPRFPLRLLPPYQGATEARLRAVPGLAAAHYPRWSPRPQTA